MQLNLTWSACGQRLSAALIGPVTYADRAHALACACREASSRGSWQFLIDFTLAWHALGNPGDKPAFFEGLRGRSELANARIAYVNCPEGNIAELLAVSDEVGFDAMMFRDRSSAIAWLEGRQPNVSFSSKARPRLVG
jgi:hypothetical protein